MSGSIIPTPLAIPTTRADRAGDGGGRDLGDGVGGHHPGRRAVGIGARQRSRDRGETRTDPFHRIAPADHAGRRDDHVVGRAAEPIGDGPGHFERIGVAVLAGRDVGVLRDHDDRLGEAVGHVPTRQRDTRPGEPALREQRSHRHRPIGGDHHEVVGVVLHPDVRDVGAKARGEFGHSRGGERRQMTGARRIGVERVADGGEDRLQRRDLSVVEVVEDPTPNALDMMRRGTFERRPATVGENGHHHTPVECGPLADDGSGLHEAVESTGETARRELQPFGEIAHPHLVALGLGQVDQHLVVAQIHPVARQIGLQRSRQVVVRPDERSPRPHFRR